MKRMTIALGSLLFFAAYSHAGVPFKVITEDIPDPSFYDTLSISVVLQDGTLFPLGYTTKPSVLKHGVDPKTIKVEILCGNENLLHISWSTFYEGMGGHLTNFSIIALESNPSTVLIKKDFYISGHSGMDNSTYGKNWITYDHSTLQVVHSITNREILHQPNIASIPLDNPLLFEVLHKKMTIQKYNISQGAIELEETIQKYKILKGDNLKRICKIMEWETEWVQNSKPLIAGKWLTAKIPYEVAVLKWPAIPKFED
jgi:hypothetical protein